MSKRKCPFANDLCGDEFTCRDCREAEEFDREQGGDGNSPAISVMGDGNSLAISVTGDYRCGNCGEPLELGPRDATVVHIKPCPCTRLFQEAVQVFIAALGEALGESVPIPQASASSKAGVA